MKTFYEMMMVLEAEGDDQEMQSPDTQAGDSPESAEAPPEMSPPADGASSGKGGMERKNYMFFSNLKAIKGMVEGMLAMDAAQVDAMLDDGHDWASDHISTSRDDVEEVHNWLSGSVGGQG